MFRFTIRDVLWLMVVLAVADFMYVEPSIAIAGSAKQWLGTATHTRCSL